jgi:hypothetical protein
MANKSGLFLFASILIAFSFAATNVKAQDKTVWLACAWDTSSIFKGKGADKFERRFYVSNLVSMTREEYLKIDSTGNRIEGLCADYLDKTVMKAATERGEKLDPGGQLTIIRNIDLSGENIGSGKDMADNIKEMKNADRFIMNFDWDATGKNEAADYANEKKRTLPTAPQK